MSKDLSGEVVTFTASAVARFTSLGRARFHGSVYYRTRSSGKLAFLNNLVGLLMTQTNKVTRLRKFGNGNKKAPDNIR